MRWKLILITSFLGALVAGGACCLLSIAGFGHFRVFVDYPWLVLIIIIPLAPIIFAAIFVYRRTAQRRKTQALVSIILTLLLTLGIYVAARRFLTSGLSMVSRPHRIN